MSHGHSSAPPDWPRAGERFGVALAVTIEGTDKAEGATLDLSESGVLFEIEAGAEPQIGAMIELTLRYSLDGQELHHRAQVQVVRVDRVGSKVNVAARLMAPLISPQ